MTPPVCVCGCITELGDQFYQHHCATECGKLIPSMFIKSTRSGHSTLATCTHSFHKYTHKVSRFLLIFVSLRTPRLGISHTYTHTLLCLSCLYCLGVVCKPLDLLWDLKKHINTHTHAHTGEITEERWHEAATQTYFPETECDLNAGFLSRACIPPHEQTHRE